MKLCRHGNACILLTCLTVGVPPHRPQGGDVGGGRGLGVVDVAKVVAAAAETIVGFLHLRRRRRYKDAAVANTLPLAADRSPTTWRARHGFTVQHFTR